MLGGRQKLGKAFEYDWKLMNVHQMKALVIWFAWKVLWFFLSLLKVDISMYLLSLTYLFFLIQIF